MKEMPYKGFLRNYSLPKVLVFLNRLRATGTLSVTAQGIVRKIYLLKGNAIFASSTYEDDRLGEVLLKVGKITVQQYDESVELLKKTGRRQGSLLVDLGYLTPKDLFWGVKYQVREIIYSLFQLQDGMYEFTEGGVPSDEVITLNMSMANLMYEGVKRIDNWTRIRREMPDTEIVLKLSDDPLSLFQEIELSPQDREILSLVDGQRTIKKVIGDSGLNSHEVLKTLYLLWSIGMITEEEGEVVLSIDEILRPVSEGHERANVDRIYGKLGFSSHFELLEVDESADVEQIRKNYYRLAKEFHPDKYAGFADTTIKDKVVVIFDALTDAYNALKNGPGGGQHVLPEDAVKTDMARAEELRDLGVQEIKEGNFPVAAEFLGEAVKICPEKANYWNYLALALSKVPGKSKEAENAIHRAIELEPANSNYHANLGFLYLREGRTDEARARFQKALSLDPDNQRAKKALA